MPEIVILSGKGGTGKTSLTAAFAHLATNKVLCDLDVDAPDLHLILKPDHLETEDFFSGNEAVLDPDLCTGCGTCMEMCRYGAVNQSGGVFGIDPIKCEGCKVCVEFCPAGAINFPQRHCGQWHVSETRFGPMIHAQLFPGQENSGKLVALLKQKAKLFARDKGFELVLCDGAPGIGCPVISSLSGTDLAVAVTEPTPSGRHDMKRVMDLCRHFRLPVGVIINKWDINPEETELIEASCAADGIRVLGRLPHDQAVTRAMVKAQAVTEFDPDGFGKLVKNVFNEVMDMACVKQSV